MLTITIHSDDSIIEHITCSISFNSGEFHCDFTLQICIPILYYKHHYSRHLVHWIQYRVESNFSNYEMEVGISWYMHLHTGIWTYHMHAVTDRIRIVQEKHVIPSSSTIVIDASLMSRLSPGCGWSERLTENCSFCSTVWSSVIGIEIAVCTWSSRIVNGYIPLVKSAMAVCRRKDISISVFMT